MSVVVSTLIMIAAVATLGSALTLFAKSSFGTIQQATADSYNQRANRLKEGLAVEDIWFNKSATTYVDVSLRNYGSLALNVTSIRINGTNAWTTGLILQPGKSVTIRVPYTWTPGVYFITVTTGRSNTLTDYRATP